jgi:hypothetical protein
LANVVVRMRKAALLVGLLLGSAACSSSTANGVHASAPATTASIARSPIPAIPLVTNESPPIRDMRATNADGHRLQHAYASADWSTTNRALDSYRVDPAPAGVRPRHAAAQMRRIVHHMFRGYYAAPGTSITLLFCLFSGNEAIVGPAPQHTLNGTRPIRKRPAWVLVINGVEIATGGGGFDAASPRPVPELRRGYVLTVLSDLDAREMTGEFHVAPATLHLD